MTIANDWWRRSAKTVSPCLWITTSFMPASSRSACCSTGTRENDGEKFLLTIFADRRSKDETMWVFSKDDLPQVELELFES